MSPRLTSILLAVALAGGLTACGRRGDLEQPAPLFGGRAAAEAEAGSSPTGPTSTGVGGAATQGATADEEGDAQEFRRPREDRRDPSQQLSPASQSPIESGSTSNPIGAPPSVTP